MDFKNKIVIVTGGAQGIGRCIAEEFEELGATVCVIDKQQGDHFVGDLADKQVLVTREPARLCRLARPRTSLHDWSSRDGNQLLLNMGAKLQKLRIFEYFCRQN